jgi:hypothetical protein
MEIRKTKVYLTVDVETSMGGAWQNARLRPVPVEKRVFCETGGRGFGLPLMVEELQRYGFRATFFVEVFCSCCLGKDALRPVFDYLLLRDQDVQLHTHPAFRNYSKYDGSPASLKHYGSLPDDMNRYSPDEQYQLLEEACGLFTEFAGFPPRAYRAGGYRADRNTLRALRKLGVGVDSSFNPCEPASFPGEPLSPNSVSLLEGVLEVPVTNARSGAWRMRGWKHLDISAILLSEMKSCLLQAHAGGVRHVVLMMHTFSLIKARDETYARFRPDWTVIRRYQGLLRFFVEHAEQFEVSVLGEFNPDFSDGDAGGVELDMGALVPCVRKGCQALNRVYWV